MFSVGVITSVGGEADEEAITQLLSELEGKSAAELVSEGMEKLKACSGGGGGGGGGGGDTTTDAPAPKVEAPKEEEVDALAGGMDMFGGGDGGDY